MERNTILSLYSLYICLPNLKGNFSVFLESKNQINEKK